MRVAGGARFLLNQAIASLGSSCKPRDRSLLASQGSIGAHYPDSSNREPSRSWLHPAVRMHPALNRYPDSALHVLLRNVLLQRFLHILDGVCCTIQAVRPNRSDLHLRALGAPTAVGACGTTDTWLCTRKMQFREQLPQQPP